MACTLQELERYATLGFTLGEDHANDLSCPRNAIDARDLALS